MQVIQTEYTKLDKQNENIEITFTVDKEVVALLKFDYKNNQYKVVGDLYNLIGWKNTEEDKLKYEKYIEYQKWFGKEILKNIK